MRDTIVVLAGGRHCCIGLGGVGFEPSNEDLAFRDSVCHLMNLFLRTMFKLRQGPVQFLGLFLATKQEEFFLKRPRIWNHFNDFLHLLDYLAAQAGPEKIHFVQMKQVLAVRVGTKKVVHCVRWWPTVCDTIVVLADGRHWLHWLAALGSYLQTKIWHFAIAFAT